VKEMILTQSRRPHKTQRRNENTQATDATKQ
jgi:hypothetical protein